MTVRGGMGATTAAVLLLLAAAGAANAQAPEAGGDPVRGEIVAGEHCSECHRALPDEQSVMESGAISFWVIATSETRSLEEIRRFLGQPHDRMPFGALTDQDRDDIIAYMRFLRGG